MPLVWCILVADLSWIDEMTVITQLPETSHISRYVSTTMEENKNEKTCPLLWRVVVNEFVWRGFHKVPVPHHLRLKVILSRLWWSVSFIAKFQLSNCMVCMESLHELWVKPRLWVNSRLCFGRILDQPASCCCCSSSRGMKTAVCFTVALAAAGHQVGTPGLFTSMLPLTLHDLYHPFHLLSNSQSLFRN